MRWGKTIGKASLGSSTSSQARLFPVGMGKRCAAGGCTSGVRATRIAVVSPDRRHDAGRFLRVARGFCRSWSKRNKVGHPPGISYGCMVGL